MDATQAQHFQKIVGVLHHGRHRVVFVALGIVGVALADLVDGVNVKPLRQAVEVEVPVLGAVGGVMGTEVAAVKKHDDRAGALFEVAGADTVNVNKFFIDHRRISGASASCRSDAGSSAVRDSCFDGGGLL